MPRFLLMPASFCAPNPDTLSPCTITVTVKAQSFCHDAKNRLRFALLRPYIAAIAFGQIGPTQLDRIEHCRLKFLGARFDFSESDALGEILFVKIDCPLCRQLAAFDFHA